MSKYTTEIRFICESLAGNKEQLNSGYRTVGETIERARPLIFSFTYPFWDMNDKQRFETMILRHFYTREICAETYGLWKLLLEDFMLVRMPYFNKLYSVLSKEYDPLTDYNEERTYNRILNNTRKEDLTGTTHSDASNNANSLTKTLDTPQNGIQDLLNGDYITTATQTTGNGEIVENGGTSADNTITDEGGENYTETVTGKRGSITYQEMIAKYKDTLFSVDMMVLSEMESLFFGLWD